MLTTLKITLLVIGLPALLLGFVVGLPFMISGLVCLGAAVAIDRRQAAIKSGKRPPNKVWVYMQVILLGIGSFFAVTSIGALGNLDTTGKASTGTTVFAVIVAITVVIGGISLGNRNKNE